LQFRLTDAGQVAIEVPDLNESERPCKHAYVFKLAGFGFLGQTAPRKQRKNKKHEP